MNTYPDKILDVTDPGDDVQRRFRYQATYAAILSLAMLKDESEISEVFCELHEEILLKLSNGKYLGIQVKTRKPHLGPFNIDSEEIEKSISRFVALNSKFKNKFSGFNISTNGSFSVQKNKCLKTICAMAQSGKSSELLKEKTASKKWIEALAKKNQSTPDEIIEVLACLRLRENFSTLDDISSKLFHTLILVPELRSQTTATVFRICEELIAKHLAAASLTHASPDEETFVLGINPEDAQNQMIISGKRITKKNIMQIISNAINDPIKLFIKDSRGFQDLLVGNKVLETKMDAGGLSIENIQLIKDQKFSFEALTSSWLYKMDEEEASRRYDQVKMIVLNECQEAHDEEEKNGTVYGTNMLKNVRKRLRARHQQDRASFFDSSYDHLLGVAGSLTEECKIWWSAKFPVKK